MRYLALGKPGLAALYVLSARRALRGRHGDRRAVHLHDGLVRPATPSATDYTVQASTVVIATAGASAASGFSAQALGYFGHFCLATVLALGAVVAVRCCFRRRSASLRGPTLEAARCA